MNAPRVSMLRALVVGILLTPFCCFWAQDQAIDRIFSLMVPPVAITMVVAALNVPLRRHLPRLALSGPEIMVVYAMLAVACAMSGEWMDLLAPQIYGYGVFQDRNPRIPERMLPYLSELFFFKDAAPLKEFADGSKSFAFFWSQLPMWLPKIGAWTFVLMLLTTAMLCINALLREQWVHQEKLAFPVVQIPLALADDSAGKNSLWHSKFLWAGFFATFSIDILNGLSFLYPTLPRINIRFIGDLNQWMTSPPWNQTGWTPIGLFPFMSAIGFFMPTDLLFSLLFFFFARKAIQMIAYSLGNEQGVFGGGGLIPAAPYFSEQSWGAFFAMFLTAMWLARPHWKKVWEAVVTGDDQAAREGAVPYRILVVLLVLCILGLGGAGVLLGMPFTWVLFYIGLFFAFSIAVTRLRAQLGAPTHEMAFMGPHQLVIDFHGTAGLQSQPELITRTMTTFHIMNRLHRTHPMPSLLEGLYLADRTGLSQRGMFLALFLALLVGTVGGFLTNIYLGYRWTPGSWVANEVSGVVNTMQTSPRAPNPSGMIAVGIGAMVVFLLDFIRFRVPGFWLHPAGYALGMNFGVDYYWFGLLLVLIIKVFVTRYYGLKGYDKLRQVAMGLIFGEMAAELLWAVFSMANDRQITYSISINGKMGWDK
jgi:hypothetical protein